MAYRTNAEIIKGLQNPPGGGVPPILQGVVDFGKRRASAPKTGAASADNYLRNLRVLQTSLRATAAGQISPVLTANISRILTEHGMATDELGKALAGGALTIPAFEATSAAGTIARELSDFQTAVEQAKGGVPRSPDVLQSAVVGAAQGFATTGSVVGAVAGGVGGLVSGLNAQSAVSRIRNAVGEAQRLASPENFAANLAKVTAAAREETFVSGQRAGLAEEAAISRGGLRGTGIGTQASIAASVAPQIAALRQSIGTASAITGNEVSARLGTPVRPPRTTLVDALGATAGAAGAFFTPERLAQMRFARTPITGGTSYTDTVRSNIYQPTIGDVGGR